MFYQIDEVSHSAFTAHDLDAEGNPVDRVVDCVYVLVRAWDTEADFNAGLRPKRVNDFLMQLSPERSNPIKRTVARGAEWLRADGVWVHVDDIVGNETWQRETVMLDIRRRIQNNIFNWWEKAEAKGYRAVDTDPDIQRDRNDPRVVLARTDVSTLEGARFERSSRTQEPTERTGRTQPRQR